MYKLKMQLILTAFQQMIRIAIQLIIKTLNSYIKMIFFIVKLVMPFC
jgi:hypothetical protein